MVWYGRTSSLVSEAGGVVWGASSLFCKISSLVGDAISLIRGASSFVWKTSSFVLEANNLVWQGSNLVWEASSLVLEAKGQHIAVLYKFASCRSGPIRRPSLVWLDSYLCSLRAIFFFVVFLVVFLSVMSLDRTKCVAHPLTWWWMRCGGRGFEMLSGRPCRYHNKDIYLGRVAGQEEAPFFNFPTPLADDNVCPKLLLLSFGCQRCATPSSGCKLKTAHLCGDIIHYGFCCRIGQ